MTPEEKQRKRDEFLAFAQALPPLPTTILASLKPPTARAHAVVAQPEEHLTFTQLDEGSTPSGGTVPEE